MVHVSDIKLIRTDTTLDLSQKAEKGMLRNVSSPPFYSSVFCNFVSLFRCGMKIKKNILLWMSKEILCFTSVFLGVIYDCRLQKAKVTFTRMPDNHKFLYARYMW